MAYPHWQYFLTLDADLQRLSRYIEIDAANYGVYSVELVRILLAASSEVDVVAKLLCDKLGTSPTKPKGKGFWTMDDSRPVIHAGYPQLAMLNVHFSAHSISLLPWKEWQHGKNPPWWQRHNDVKHHRGEAYGAANLGNVLHAVAGLFVLVLYLYGEEYHDLKLYPEARMLALDDEYVSHYRVTEKTRLPGI